VRLGGSSAKILIAFNLLLALSSVSALYAGSVDTAKAQPQFDLGLYNRLMSQRVDCIDDIVAEYENQQREWLPIVPPGPDGYLKQEAGMYVFNPSGFSPDFIKALVPDTSQGGITYLVWVFEDLETRNRVIVNASGDITASIPPPADYSPNWLVKEMYPDLYNGTVSHDMMALTEAIYDPARIISGFRLITKEELIKNVWEQSLSSQNALAAAAVRPDGGIGPMMAYTGAPVSHLQFTAIERTNNAVTVTIAYPASYTNRLEIFTCSDLVPGWFYSAGTTNINPSTNWVEWTDANGGWTNFSPRFYACGNADIDSDSDGLKDAQEKYVYHTSRTNSDTDGDGLSDYQEVITLHTDPNNPDTNKPIIFITFPTNNFSWEWLP
jgi:hypothetical protein